MYVWCTIYGTHQHQQQQHRRQCFNLSYLLTVAKKLLDPKTQPQNTHCTQSTTTKHTPQADHHPTPLALPYLNGNTSRRPSFWFRQFLSVQGRGAASGLLSPPLVPLFGVPKRDPSKNREMDGALTLDGRSLTEKTTIN
jgi:hypothetical protein